MSLISQSLFMLGNRILLAPLFLVLGALILWLVSNIMKLPKRNFLTAILVSLIMFILNTFLSIFYSLTFTGIFGGFNLAKFDTITLLMFLLTALLIFIVQIALSTFVIKEVYDTTGRRALGAFFLYLIISMAILLVIGLMIFLAGASIFSSAISKFAM